MSCVFKNLSIFGENALSVDQILRNVVNNRNVVPESSAYRQIKALLKLCSLDSANESMKCLLQNNKRFGLNEWNKTVPGLILEMTLNDLLKDGVTTSSCQKLTSAPLKDIYDVFVIEFIKVVRMF